MMKNLRPPAYSEPGLMRPWARFRSIREPFTPLCVLIMAFGLLIAAQTVLAADNSSARLSSEVNPLIGTGQGPGGTQNLFPGPTMPFGMVQLSPDTEIHGYGYLYQNGEIQGFSMTHMSGVGCANSGDVFFTATTGPIQTKVSGFESPYSHSREQASAGYYEVHLSRWNIDAALTATDRTGFAQFTFPAGQPANILVPISHTLTDTQAAQVHVSGNDEITGYVEDHLFCGLPQTYKVYFVMKFNRPFQKFGTWSDATPASPKQVSEGSREAAQNQPTEWVGAFATWAKEEHPQTVVAKVAISYVSQAGAEKNFAAEAQGKSFQQVRDEAQNTWDKELSVIQVSGGTPTERRVFYTSLYHSLMMPNILNDVDGSYPGAVNGKTEHVAQGHEIYANFSGWDIYRSQMPLLALIEPKRMEDMAESITLMYQQGGWIAKWPQLYYYANQMAGSPLSVVVATAWLDGLHGFDMKSAWQGMYLDATEAPPPGSPAKGEDGIDWINAEHYVPNDKVRYGSVSQIQEDAVAYASLYRLAKDLGKADQAKTLYERALYYRNVFDHQDKYFRPRDSDGRWTPDFTPTQRAGFIEGTGWHYQWMAPSDLGWLIHAVGPQLFNQRLTQFFNYPKPAWYPQYYNPYNETDLEAPFEFNFSGEPWMSQKVVRRILRENYPDDPNGIPGNDDAGEMSSWAVMGMLGIYSVDPASLAYELTSPLFSSAAIHLRAPYSGKTFTIEASPDPESNQYIQSVQLNGRPVEHNWIPFQQIRAGGTLHVVLGPDPNRSWGAAPEDAPPSLSDEKP